MVLPAGSTIGPGAPADDKVPAYVPARYKQWVASAARRTGLSPAIVAAQINTESGFQPGVTSSAGAEGIAQFLPSTFRTWGKGSPFNPSDSLNAYVAFMNHLLKAEHGNVRNALAAYNAGEGNIGAGLGYANHILSAAHSPNSLLVDVPGRSGGSGGGGLLSWPGDIVSAAGNIGQAIDWFLHPNHWIRIFAGGAGVLLLGVGIFDLSHVGGSITLPVIGSVGAPATALPLGVLFTGLGAMLLFVAFHNVPDNVTNIGEFTGFLVSKVKQDQTAASG